MLLWCWQISENSSVQGSQLMGSLERSSFRQCVDHLQELVYSRLAVGPDNHRGARAMYLDGTVYRIRGTNAPAIVGATCRRAVSASLTKTSLTLFRGQCRNQGDRAAEGSPRWRRGRSARLRDKQGFPVNHPIYSADRTSHLKIIIIALMVAIAGVSLALSSCSNSDAGSTQTAGVIKAGKPILTTNSGALVIR